MMISLSLSQSDFDNLLQSFVYCCNWADSVVILEMPFATFSLLDILIGSFVGELTVYVTFRLSGGRQNGGGD